MQPEQDHYYFEKETTQVRLVTKQSSIETIDGATHTLDNAGNRTAKADQRTAVAISYGYDNIYQQLTAAPSGAAEPTILSGTLDLAWCHFLCDQRPPTQNCERAVRRSFGPREFLPPFQSIERRASQTEAPIPCNQKSPYMCARLPKQVVHLVHRGVSPP